MLRTQTALPVTHSFADPAIAVTNHEVREAMNHLTRAPDGTETLPGSYNVTFDQYLGVLPQFFVPTLRFQYASVMKGTFGHLRTMYRTSLV